MKLSVGLTRTNLKELDHPSVVLGVTGPARLYQVDIGKSGNIYGIVESDRKRTLLDLGASTRLQVHPVPGSGKISVVIDKRKFVVENGDGLVIVPSSASTKIVVSSLKRAGGRGSAPPAYKGTVAIFGRAGKLRLSLVLDIDDYLRGVLQSEIPASYHIEAIKAQAVAARTYSLNPRVDHGSDRFNVCDSYLCCQYFGGLNMNLSSCHREAIEATAHQILLYEGKPILALFSSNAGGHTESYENCFSDQKSNQFPPLAIPYLIGVSEALTASSTASGSEAYLRTLWSKGVPNTVDSWSPHFKWSVSISGNQLESHFHSNIKKLADDPETAPFVVAPASCRFGHILDIGVSKRGVSGSAMEVEIKTSQGNWLVKKELVIRSLFVIPELKLKRLKSARFYVNRRGNASGLITGISLHGLGWGHGVGLQQTGAQGWAKRGLSYRKILAHYYQGTNIERA